MSSQDLIIAPPCEQRLIRCAWNNNIVEEEEQRRSNQSLQGYHWKGIIAVGEVP